MARKKSSSIFSKTHEEILKNPQTKSHRDLSPDNNKMDNLRTLNQLLLQETMEKRFQIENLKSQIEEIEESQSFVLDLEREVSRIVLASAIADEAKKLRYLNEEKEEVKKELETVVSESGLLKKEVDLRRSEVGDLEVKVRDLERDNVEVREKLGEIEVEKDEMKRILMKKEEAFESLREMMEDVEKEREEVNKKHKEEIKSMKDEIGGNLRKIESLEEEGRAFLVVKDSLVAEISLLKSEGDLLNIKVLKLNEKILADIMETDKLRTSISILEKEKKEKKQEFNSAIRELSLELDDMRKKIGEISSEKEEVVKEKTEQKIEIIELKKEVKKLQSNLIKLEKTCEDYSELNARLLDETVAIKKEFDILEKKMVVKEKEAEARIGELMMKMNDSSSKVREISMAKDEVEGVKTKQDEEIIILKKEVKYLRYNVSELEKKIIQLRDERDAVERELGIRIEESKRLLSQVHELKKGKDEYVKELEELNALMDTLVLEKEKEKSFMVKKMNDSETVSDKVLSLLKNTTKAVNGDENGQENGIIEDEEKIRPFAVEIERIKKAFKIRVEKFEETNREFEVLKKNKKKQGLFMWLYPAATVLAAISFYAARGR